MMINIDRTERQNLKLKLELTKRQIAVERANPNAHPKNISTLTKQVEQLKAQIDNARGSESEADVAVADLIARDFLPMRTAP